MSGIETKPIITKLSACQIVLTVQDGILPHIVFESLTLWVWLTFYDHQVAISFVSPTDLSWFLRDQVPPKPPFADTLLLPHLLSCWRCSVLFFYWLDFCVIKLKRWLLISVSVNTSLIFFPVGLRFFFFYSLKKELRVSLCTVLKRRV